MKQKVFTTDVIVHALYLLRVVRHRRSVTAHELQLFQTHIQSKASKEGIEVEFVPDNLMGALTFGQLVDTLLLNGEPVYRIKPTMSFQALDNLAYQYEISRAISRIPGLDDMDHVFIHTLNDFSEETERACPEFQAIDEKYQLDIIYQLYDLERQKRQLEQNLKTIRSDSTSIADDVKAEAIFEQDANITRADFLEQMGRK